MSICQFHAPTQILVSDDCADDLARLLAHEKPARVALLVDRNVQSLDRVQRLLRRAEDSGARTDVVSVDAREPDTDLVDQQAAVFKAQPPDVVIGVGGGSTLDLAKAVGALAANPGAAAEYQGRELLPHAARPTIMIPTTAGTGSEVTPGAVVLNPRTRRKGAIASRSMFPRYALLDPALTASMPRRVAAATGMDALAHAIESFTARCATPVTRMYSREAFRLISGSLPALLSNGDSPQLRRTQQVGATLAGVAICNSDTGACHSISYALGIHCGVPHAMAVALLLPHVLDVNIRKGARQYAELAEMLPEDESERSEEARCRRLQRFVARLVRDGIGSASLGDYGVQPADLPALAERGLDLTTALTNNPVDFTADDVRHVLTRLMKG